MGSRAFRGHVPGKPNNQRERYPCDKLRPQKIEPNAKVLAARKALGLTEKSTMGPVAFAYTRGWLNRRELVNADIYADAYRHAGLDSPTMSSAKDASVATGAAAHLQRAWEDLSDEDVRRLRWGVDFSDYETAKIWDSALRPHKQDGGANPSAMRRWRSFAQAMTPAERDEVDRVVLQGLWPSWMLSRHQEIPDPAGEKRRGLLVSGLRKIGGVADQRTPANDRQANDNDSPYSR